MKPEWNNEGEAQNLAAASEDALEWLVTLSHSVDVQNLLKRFPDNQVRLSSTIETLKKFLDAPDADTERLDFILKHNPALGWTREIIDAAILMGKGKAE